MSSGHEDSPTSVSAAGQGDILVSLTGDANHKNGVWLWATTDNLRDCRVDRRRMCRDPDCIPAEGSDSMIRWAGLACAWRCFCSAPGCGYHTVGSKAELPQNIRTIAIPGFVSHSQTFRIEQLLTDAVVREFNARTQYHVIHESKGDADAVLKATVLSASATPLAYDSQTGRAASALVTVSIQVTLTDRQGKVLFENPSYLFHDQYELSRDLPSFFEEDSPAVDRLSRDFARTLVANILEAY